MSLNSCFATHRVCLYKKKCDVDDKQIYNAIENRLRRNCQPVWNGDHHSGAVHKAISGEVGSITHNSKKIGIRSTKSMDGTCEDKSVTEGCMSEKRGD